MQVCRSAEMRAADRAATERYGIPGACLMQTAGDTLARAAIAQGGGTVRGRRVTILCGRGNNGGDGFVAARRLRGAGAAVTVLLAGPPDALKGDAAIHFAPLAPMEIEVQVAQEGAPFPQSDLILDCLLGTGATGAPRDAVARLIDAANAYGAPIVACDIPSGVDADTGRVEGVAIRAAATVTFVRLKPGLLLYPGAAHAGRVLVADIGIPEGAVPASAARLSTRDAIAALLPPRAQGRDANKGAFGKVLVVAGSVGMAGAAVLTATAALRAGAGLVYLAIPESLADTAAVLAPEVVLRPVPETPARTHGGAGAVERLRELAEGVDAVAVGPGLGIGPERDALVAALLSAPVPIVVDADGIGALGRTHARRAPRTGPIPVLTPHPGEMGGLLGTSTAAVQDDRPAAAREAARRFHAVALLKGARTLVATPDGHLDINRDGTPALAVAGSGDVLTGVVAALLAAGLSPGDAARAGAFLHARAGEIAAREIGIAGVLAGEIRDRLPAARHWLDAAENPQDGDEPCTI